ncbi:MAG: hypothetical protein HC857_00205 [Synechococcales cyanobacterium RU_4_20]|nr:hypothetical protein [Synechococcales cyanobacterium RU_4_20]
MGAALGGDGYEAVALEQARVATRNALFWPWFQPDTVAQPQVVWTLPPLVQLGLAGDQARAIEQDGRTPTPTPKARVQLLSAYPHDNLRLQLADRVVGGIQLRVHPSGKLLGATVMGAEATEWSGAIAWPSSTNSPSKPWPRCPGCSPALPPCSRLPPSSGVGKS